jgi:hypothetical protein
MEKGELTMANRVQTPKDLLNDRVLLELAQALRNIYPLILPEFKITGKMPPGYCTRVDYEISYYPGVLISTIETEKFPVSVDCHGHEGEIVRSATHYFTSGKSETQKGVFVWEIPDYADFQPDWTGSATVTVNPPGPDHIAERSETDNTIEVEGTCIG